MIDLGFTAALCSALFWALGSFIYKQIISDLPPLILNLLKTILALFFLSPVIIYLFWIKYPFALNYTNIFILLFSGLLGIGLGDTLFFNALFHLRPLPLIIIMLFGQALTIILAVILLQEKISLFSGIGIILISIGIACILSAHNKKNVRSNKKIHPVKGYVFAFLASIAMAVSFIISKKMLLACSPLDATITRLCGALLILIPWCLISTNYRKNILTIIRNVKIVKIIISGVLCSTLGAFIALHIALKYSPAFMVNALISTEPLFVIILGTLFFQDKASLTEIIGSLCAILGIIIVSR
jgi:drug/metabolite transporter (DMT)-like permease